MQTIGRYQIIRELGRGAMGVVYLGEDPAIGRSVAIKTINLDNLSEGAEQQMLRDRLMREARSAGILSHPGIVTIYDITQSEHVACVVMEYVEGTTLYDRMTDGPLDSGEVLNILEQTAAALDYAHGKGVLHRDIKPANLMVTTDGITKVMDFGIARIASQKTATTSMVLGTPSYMAPEQISSKPLSPATDQFSIGVLAFELIAGVKPFNGESMSSLLFNIVFKDPLSVSELNATLPPAVEQVLRKALSKEPGDRYPNCTQFIKALRAACETKESWRPNRTVRGSSATLPPEFLSTSATTSTTVMPAAEPTPMPKPVVAAAPPPPPAPAEILPPPPPTRSQKPEPKPEPKQQEAKKPEVKKEVAPPPPPPLAFVPPPAASRSGSKAPVIAMVAVAAVLCGSVIYFTRPASDTSATDGAAAGSPPPLVDPNAAAAPSTPAGASKSAANSTPPPVAAAKPKEPAKTASEPAAQPATNANGLTPIEISTIPPNARVSFKDASCNTPCSLDLPKGDQHIKAELNGYKTIYQRVSVPAQMEVAVKLEAAVGWLDVPGPKDAVVYIDGKAWNRPAPVSIPVAPGEHIIWVIFADGHKSNEQKLNVKEDARYPLSYQ